jgi:hypothetical protein
MKILVLCERANAEHFCQLVQSALSFSVILEKNVLFCSPCFSAPLPCKFETYLLFYILQFAKENPLNLDLPAIKLDEHDDVTEEAVATTLKRAISRFSTLQAHDGHWPGDYGGPMFLMPGLVLP